MTNAKISGSSKPLEQFDDEALQKARLEILLEIPQETLKIQQDSFETAWDNIYTSSYLPGLDTYEDDEIDEYQLLLETFDVRTPSHLLSPPFPSLSPSAKKYPPSPLHRPSNPPSKPPPNRATPPKRNSPSTSEATKPDLKPSVKRSEMRPMRSSVRKSNLIRLKR